ncbi:Uncharacterised protein [Mycobacteroides abscessus]|nr:Uncharacterised protein [Mycobacteroides abscessus]CPR88586.1 Uncharacterised protein [Mycobacteroides abscessus]CPS43524.1 Uncharacterised protein [Mycobacteroides abscessus]CPV03313.1 Uncharacterised protein [Mycobacteroides abscessus]
MIITESGRRRSRGATVARSVTLLCTRCGDPFDTNSIRDHCPRCQLAQQEVWPEATHAPLGEMSGL